MKETEQISWQVAGSSGDAVPIPQNETSIGSTFPQMEFNRIPHVVAIGLILLICGLAPLAYRFTARLADDGDPFTYAEYGKEILAGKRLYSDIYFDKGPLSTLGYAIPQIAFPRDYLAIGAFMGLLLIVQSLILLWNFRTNPPALVAITLFTIIFPLSAKAYAWLSTEHLSNLFVACNLILAYCIARTGRFTLLQCFFVGVFSCLALNTRQTALISGLVPTVAIVMSGGTIRRVILGLASAFIGGIFAMAAVLLVVQRMADMQGYLDALFFHPATYSGLGSWHDAWRLLTENSTGPLATLAIIFVALALFSRYPALAASAVIAGFLTIILPRRDFNHYLVGLFPYIALLIGIGLERHAKTSAIFCWSTSAFVIYAACNPILSTLHEAQNHPRELELVDVAELADRIAPPSATILVWGKLGSEPIVFASNLPRANKYWILWTMDKENAPLLPASPKYIFDQYLQNPPTVLVMDRDFLNHMNDGTPVPYYDKSFELGKALLRKFHYEVKDSIHGFDIAVLDNSPIPITRPTTTAPDEK
jgi:hypothetical protein